MKPLPALLLVLSACGAAPSALAPPASGQSFRDAMRQLCEVDHLAGISPAEGGIAVGLKRTAWVAEHVDNPDGIEFRTRLSVKAASDQAAMIRVEAKAVGLQSCPLADVLERDGEGGLSP